MRRDLRRASFGSEWRPTGFDGSVPPGKQPRRRIRQAARIRAMRRHSTARMDPARRFLWEEMEDLWVAEVDRAVLYGIGELRGEILGILDHPGIERVTT